MTEADIERILAREGHLKSATDMVKHRRRIAAAVLKVLENHARRVVSIVGRDVILNPE